MGEGTYCILKYLPGSFCLKQSTRRQKGKQKADGKEKTPLFNTKQAKIGETMHLPWFAGYMLVSFAFSQVHRNLQEGNEFFTLISEAVNLWGTNTQTNKTKHDSLNYREGVKHLSLC